MLAKPSFPRLNRGDPLAQGLVLGLPMYEGSGLTANDLSGQGNNGTLNGGVTWAGGQSGWALNFDGSTGYVQIASAVPATLQVGPIFTVGGWIYVTSFGTYFYILGASNFDTDVHGFEFFISRLDGRPAFYVNGSAAGSYLIAANPINLNTWYRIIGVADGTHQHIYLNGVQVATEFQTQNPDWSIVYPLIIGGEADLLNGVPNSQTFSAGLIDSVFIVNGSAWSPQTVALDYADSFRLYRPQRSGWLKAAGGGTTISSPGVTFGAGFACATPAALIAAPATAFGAGVPAAAPAAMVAATAATMGGGFAVGAPAALVTAPAVTFGAGLPAATPTVLASAPAATFGAGVSAGVPTILATATASAFGAGLPSAVPAALVTASADTFGAGFAVAVPSVISAGTATAVTFGAGFACAVPAVLATAPAAGMGGGFAAGVPAVLATSPATTFGAGIAQAASALIATAGAAAFGAGFAVATASTIVSAAATTFGAGFMVGTAVSAVADPGGTFSEVDFGTLFVESDSVLFTEYDMGFVFTELP